MRRWGVKYGVWWMLQWAFDGTLSLGIHIDPRTRPWVGDLRYGPYVDVHLGFCALSLGYHPARANNHSLMRPELAQRGD
jgi:hypothetical protein